MQAESRQTAPATLARGLSLLDAAMIVVGSMVGSGIFIVSADIARLVRSPGLLLVVWLVTGRSEERRVGKECRL